MAMLTFFASPETKITAAYATQYTELNTRFKFQISKSWKSALSKKYY